MTCEEIDITHKQYAKYRNYGGFLIVFLVQMILWIIAGLANYLTNLYLYEQYNIIVSVIDIIPYVLITLTLIFLHKAKPCYLIIYYFYTAYTFLNAILVLILAGSYSTFIFCVCPVIWCIYFNVSKRVKVYLGKVIPPPIFIDSNKPATQSSIIQKIEMPKQNNQISPSAETVNKNITEMCQNILSDTALFQTDTATDRMRSFCSFYAAFLYYGVYLPTKNTAFAQAIIECYKNNAPEIDASAFGNCIVEYENTFNQLKQQAQQNNQTYGMAQVADYIYNELNITSENPQQQKQIILKAMTQANKFFTEKYPAFIKPINSISHTEPKLQSITN